MLTQTGNIAIVYAAPVGIPDASAPDGLRVEEQLSVTLKSAADEKEYQFNLPISDKTPASSSSRSGRRRGSSSPSSRPRSVPCPSSMTPARMPRAIPSSATSVLAARSAVGGNTIEADAFVVFQGYDIRLAGSVDHAQEAQKAHGEYLKRQAEYRRRSVQARIEKAKERIAAQKEAVKASQAAQNGAARPGLSQRSGDASRLTLRLTVDLHPQGRESLFPVAHP